MAAEPKPFADDKTNPEKLREPRVEKLRNDYDKRTRQVTPWLNEDGTQSNGAEDLPKREDTVEGKEPAKVQTAGKKAVGRVKSADKK